MRYYYHHGAIGQTSVDLGRLELGERAISSLNGGAFFRRAAHSGHHLSRNIETYEFSYARILESESVGIQETFLPKAPSLSSNFTHPSGMPTSNQRKEIFT